ncbi:hypothetical protein DYB32_004962 [Aphanomyces invadans]|uniref:Kinesin motor domain-containing protein n=1 Tax=Aphanomyces invadans TaxID=157072 RepID=A0A418AVZ0_9STRA|nr:hypothetical protein DYB32_004962 [Aphanomyces invadans]
MNFASATTAAVLHELFRQCTDLVGFATIQCSLSYLGIYSEHVYDLLAIVDDSAATSHAVHGGFTDACCAPTATSNNHQPMVVLDVRNDRDALIAVEEGQRNLDRLLRRFPTMEHLTHLLLTVCVTVDPAFSSDGTSQPIKSKLQLASGDGGLECTWQDTERIRATISAENSLNALTTCLGDIRSPNTDPRGDSVAMRYHASKLTLLLQDCLHDEVG